MPENVSTEKDMKVFTSAEEMKEIAHVPLPPQKKIVHPLPCLLVNN